MLINANKLRDTLEMQDFGLYQKQQLLVAFDAAVKEVQTAVQNRVIKNLQEVAGQRQADEREDFCAGDFGNYDDAYNAGRYDGERQSAYEVLTAFQVPFEREEDD